MPIATFSPMDMERVFREESLRLWHRVDAIAPAILHPRRGRLFRLLSFLSFMVI